MHMSVCGLHARLSACPATTALTPCLPAAQAQFLQPMTEGGPAGLPTSSQGVPAFSPAELASAWAAASAAHASSGPMPGPAAAREWAPAPDFHQVGGGGGGAPGEGPSLPASKPSTPSAADLLGQLHRLQQAQAMERAASVPLPAGSRRAGRRAGGGPGGPAAQAALQAHLALLSQQAAAQAGALAIAAEAQQQRGARGGEGVAGPFAGEPGAGGGLAWPWEQLEGTSCGLSAACCLACLALPVACCGCCTCLCPGSRAASLSLAVTRGLHSWMLWVGDPRLGTFIGSNGSMNCATLVPSQKRYITACVCGCGRHGGRAPSEHGLVAAVGGHQLPHERGLRAQRRRLQCARVLRVHAGMLSYLLCLVQRQRDLADDSSPKQRAAW